MKAVEVQATGKVGVDHPLHRGVDTLIDQDLATGRARA